MARARAKRDGSPTFRRSFLCSRSNSSLAPSEHFPDHLFLSSLPLRSPSFPFLASSPRIDRFASVSPNGSSSTASATSCPRGGLLEGVLKGVEPDTRSVLRLGQPRSASTTPSVRTVQNNTFYYRDLYDPYCIEYKEDNKGRRAWIMAGIMRVLLAALPFLLPTFFTIYFSYELAHARSANVDQGRIYFLAKYTFRHREI